MESHSKSNEIISEKEALDQLRKGLVGVLKPDVTDSVLMKWLRTNNFNIDKAIRLYKEYIWTKSAYKTDDLENYQIPEVIQKYGFDSPIGYAKDGSPVSYLCVGRGDYKGFINSLDIVDICKYASYVIEKDLRRCREQSKKLGKDINSITYIADFEEFSLRQVLAPGMIEIGFDLFQMLQDHYPEVWNHIILINIPYYYYFETLFKIFKPCLSHTFIKKIYLTSKDNHADLLLKFIDPEVLPAFLGGKRVDSYNNPMCDEIINFGGTIRPEYYITNKLKLSTSEPGVVDVWIPARNCYNYIIIVREADSTLKAEYRSEGGSIGARVFYREFSKDREKSDLPSTTEYLDHCNNDGPWRAVSPCIHVPAHKVPINNHCSAPWPGIYVFRFDNSGSWLSGRRIVARIRALPPGTNPETNFLQNVVKPT